MVSPVGLEPTTCGLEVRCSVRLSHGNRNAGNCTKQGDAGIRSRNLNPLTGPYLTQLIRLSVFSMEQIPAQLQVHPETGGVAKEP